MTRGPGPEFENAQYQDCTCPGWTSDCLAEGRVKLASPSEAVEIVAAEPPKSCFISTLTPLLLAKNNEYIKNGIFSVLLRHVLRAADVKTRPSFWDYPSWLIPLRGVYVCLNSVYASPHIFIPEALPLIAELRPHLREIVDIMWKDHDLLKPKSGIPDGMRESIALFFGLCSADKEMKIILYGDKSIEMMMTCFLEMRQSYWPGKLDFVNSIDYYFNPNLGQSKLKIPIPDDLLPRVLRMYSPNYIASKFVSWLRNKELLDDGITTNLLFMIRFMQLAINGKHAKWMRTVSASGLHIPLCHAIERQLVDGGDPWYQTSHVSQFGMSLMVNLSSISNPYDVYSDLLIKTPFIDVAARSWHLGCNATNIPEVDMFKFDWNLPLVELLRWLEGGILSKHEELAPALINDARQAIELAYSPTLFWVPKKSLLTPGPVATWKRLFRLLGITEVTIRERRKLLRKCCNTDCPMRVAGKRSNKKYICSRCETVFYCGRSCQKADWRKHKKGCDHSHFASFDSLSLLYKSPSKP